MTFSVIIPAYNGEFFIEETLLSVLVQSRPADEIIVSDDSSTDKTLEICQKYEDKIKIYRNADGPSGFVRGWNKALEHNTCDYVCILHQDDLLDKDFLQEAEKALSTHNDIKHFFTPCKYIDEDSNELENQDYCDGTLKRYQGNEYITAYLTVGDPHIHRCPGVITHKDIFEVCKYREQAGHIADDDFFYRVGQYTDVLGLFLPLASYRIHPNSETGHLKATELTLRLINDYDFQLKDAKNNKVLTTEHIQYFKTNKNKYIRRLFGYGLKNKKANLVLTALKYYIL